jgi:purine-binding chemotaxis protein CheW
MKKGSVTDDTPRKRINWSEIHERLGRAELALARQRTESEKKRILRERARALATVSDQSATETLEVLEFLLAQEKYGVETSYVREVSPLKDLTPLPCTPPFVLGIINVRSEILSVIDLKKFFDIPERGVTDLNKVIIVDDGAMAFGIMADVIAGVRMIAAAEIQPPLHMFSGIQAEYLRGVTPERLVVLDTARILSAQALIVHEET